MQMQKITPFLWFDNQAEEAAKFYTSVFKNAKLGKVTRYGEAGPGPAGSVLTASFEIEGMEFTALNGGPIYKFTEAVSFVVNCETQEEVDHCWERLTADGGKEVQCGWLKDKFGLSWQIVPAVLPRLLNDPDAAKANRVMQSWILPSWSKPPEAERTGSRSGQSNDGRSNRVRPFRLYRGRTQPYVPRRFEKSLPSPEKQQAMRQETQTLVDEIKQAIGLLRRHL
jgi:predicted 3-demethylubiquinone-9 3-methyltransferase (glyoxalase superfamily)